jgi:hypothetical protein
MNVISAEAKQAVIRQVLESLAAAKAPTVRVRLFATIAEGPNGIRGLLNPAPRPPISPSGGVDESDLPPAFREEGRPSLRSLRLGQELHVVLSAPTRGYLHLFNLGSSGEVRRMLPRPGELPAVLEADRACLALPSPSMPWVEKGPLNGFPERVLAVVTTQPQAVPPSCLHPSFNDAAYARGFGPPIIDALLAAWPSATWSWGACEARLEP